MTKKYETVNIKCDKCYYLLVIDPKNPDEPFCPTCA